MSMFDHSIRFPLAAAMLAAMGGVSAGCSSGPAAREAMGGAESGHRTIGVGEVPGPALTAIDAQLSSFQGGGRDDGASVDEYLRFEENGETMYVGQTVIAGRRTAVEVHADGEVCCVEVEVPLSELPAAVKRVSDAETGSYPARAYWKKLSRGATTYVVNARSSARAKHLEIDELGRVLKSEMLD
jgi:hypothetical protein